MDAFAVRVAYDEETGHPFDIHIDYDDRIVDDEEWIAKATLYPVEIFNASKTEVATEPPVTITPTASATGEDASDRGLDSGHSMLTISACLGYLSWIAIMILMM